MLSMQWIREAPDEVRDMLARRGTTAPVDEVLALDGERRSILTEVEQLKAERNQAGKAIGRARDAAARDALIAAQRSGAGRIDALDERRRAVDAQLHDLLAQFPNRLHPDTPDGRGEADNQVLRTVGLPRAFGFAPKPHWEIGAALRILEIERATAMAGSRMYALRGQGARLQRALINHLLEQNEEAGYESWYLPNLVRADAMFASGQLPKFHDNLYRDAEEDFYLVPTAEVPLTSLHRDEILDAAALPLRYTAHTPCYRREKMSAGRDVRGIKRVHQFEKVEMYQFTTPEGSAAALEEMVAHAEGLLAGLGLTYRVLQLCSADLRLQRRDLVRPGSLGAGRGGMAGGEQHQQLPGLPGAAGEHPLPARGQGVDDVRAHAQRQQLRHDAGAGGDPGDVPARGRGGGRARRAPASHGAADADRAARGRGRMTPPRRAPAR